MKDREAWHGKVHEVSKNQKQLNNRTTKLMDRRKIKMVDINMVNINGNLESPELQLPRNSTSYHHQSLGSPNIVRL